jgi:hypothetical protein
MCINYQTSLAAFIIGETTGLYLLFSKNKEKRCVGLFIIFYSLIQLFELLLYVNKTNNQIYKKMLVLNLGFQGLVFFILLSQIYKVNSIYLIASCLISFIVMLSVFNEIDITFTEANCLKWNFLNSIIGLCLAIMYFIMFLWIAINPTSNYIKYVGLLLFLTFIFSYFILYDMPNKPGIWCLSSAITAPLFLLKNN